MSIEQNKSAVDLPLIPNSWAWSDLGEICLKPQYGWTTSAVKIGTLHLVRTTDITSGSIDWDTVPFCQKEPEEPEKYILDDGDIVISRAGSVGYSYLIRNPRRAVFASYLIRFIPLIRERYLAFFLKSQFYWNAISERSIGIAVQNVNATKLQQVPIPIPPLSEQHRIVEKIEELFTKLDAGIDSLKKVQAQLKRYRQSVLKAAVEGKLTKEWREAHKGELEPASVLLEHILRERRGKWEAEQLEMFDAKGKVPKDGKWKGRYRNPLPVDAKGLPALPEQWTWARLDTIASIKGGITKNTKREVENGRMVPYLRVANVQRGYLELTEIKEIEATEDVISELALQQGDILFTEGGDRDKLGRGWIWQNQIPECIYQNHVFRARLHSSDISSKLVSWFGNSFGQEYFMREGKQTTNLASINLMKLSAFPVPMPPMAEQKAIVEEIERLLSISDEIETAVESELKRAERLRQSILKQAFSGKLVPQDPSDEPATVLLERIKAEKAKREKPAKRAKEPEQVKLF